MLGLYGAIAFAVIGVIGAVAAVMIYREAESHPAGWLNGAPMFIASVGLVVIGVVGAATVGVLAVL